MGGTIIVATNSQAAIRAVERIANTGRATMEAGKAIRKAARSLIRSGREIKM